jgi:hypothetical protein
MHPELGVNEFVVNARQWSCQIQHMKLVACGCRTMLQLITKQSCSHCKERMLDLAAESHAARDAVGIVVVRWIASCVWSSLIHACMHAWLVWSARLPVNGAYGTGAICKSLYICSKGSGVKDRSKLVEAFPGRVAVGQEHEWILRLAQPVVEP